MKKIILFVLKNFLLIFLLTIFFYKNIFAADISNIPLPISQAFVLTTYLHNNNQVNLNWKIAPYHYLYKDKFKFTLNPSEYASLGKILLPSGQKKHDEILGDYEVYKNNLNINFPIQIKNNNKKLRLNLQTSYQGCTAWGYCYPPITKIIKLDFNTRNISFDLAKNMSEQDKAMQLLKNKDYFSVLLGFLGFGLLLAFTPCVLPMIPILSSIIVNQQKNVIAHKAFLLALTYVLSMSLTYAGIGVLVSLAGNNIQAALQKPLALIFGSMLFVLLALSLFGFYELRLPHRIHDKIHHLSSRQKGGNFLSVFIMGFLSTLIISPCVTPPLVGALAYIATTGNMMLGAGALFFMGLGMGIPLLCLGALGGKFLPKAGPWMEIIRKGLGVLMLAVALELLSRIIPGPISLALWGCFFIGCAVFINSDNKLRKIIALILLIQGAVMISDANISNSESLFINTKNTENFKSIHSTQEALAAVKLAKEDHKPVIIDFYADWCVTCKKMDKNIFSNPKLHDILNHFTILRADVTRNNEEDQMLEHYFHVIAPPTLIFFDREGRQLLHETLVGETKQTEFIHHLEKILDES